MPRFFTILLVLLALAIPAHAQETEGDWHGILETPMGSLTLIIRITADNTGTLAGTLESPDQAPGALMPLTSIRAQDQNLEFTLQAANIRYEATWEDGVWVGTFHQGGQLPLTLEPGLPAPRAKRAQEPEGPLPYDSFGATIENPRAEGVTLAGTLTTPRGEGPFPGVVLITGSGAQDRDQSLMGHKPFLVLADQLTRRGIAVLRYDDRGFAHSTGQFAGATSTDFALDARAAMEYLRRHPKVRTDAVGLVGHSEGGIVAPLVVEAGGDPNFLVLLAGPGTDMIQLLVSQSRLMGLAEGEDAEVLEEREPILRELFEATASAGDEEEAAERLEELLTDEIVSALGATPEQRPMLIGALSATWMRALLSHDPAGPLSKVRVPVLALNGGLDLQVPPKENLEAIASALRDNPDATTTELPGLNHLFQPATTGALSEYAQIETTFDPATIELIATWINTRFGEE
ncbi:MAG: lysophospholipase [Phycisphaera sp.]|nr:MAG: lysophospholipase [Phycisphaera sp.]